MISKTIITLNNQNYIQIKSQINFLSNACDIIEIFSLNELFRYSKLIILDNTKTKIIWATQYYITKSIK